MRNFQSTQNLACCLAAAFTLASAGAATTTPSETHQIAARPLTHQEIHDYGMPEGTQVAGGLMTVGVGQPAYLEAQVLKGTPVSNVVWMLVAKPADSTAELAPSPLDLTVPIYGPGDRELHDLAARTVLIPDKLGRYTVSATATITTNGAEIHMTNHVIAANYVGVGQLDGAAPQFPQCSLCHGTPWIKGDQVTPWSKTGHATFFTEAIDGIKSSHYNSGCIQCHVLGYDTAASADNGGFDDIATLLGWSFPATTEPGNWAAMPSQLKQMANIQCENCHGPGSEHGWSGGNPALISVSYSAGDCAQCHDEGPYHVKNQEWNNSRHAIATQSPTGEGRGSCVGCHSAIGFIDQTDGVATLRTDYEAITCAACHDPHDATNPHQIRTVADVTLKDTSKPGGPTVMTLGGKGKLCMNCHISRRDAVTYVEGTGSSHFGPHYGPQTDMLAGVNAVTYGKTIPSSGHLYAVEDSCVTCHLQATARTDAAHLQAGGHTFKPAWDGGTPEDRTDDVHLVGSCVKCHGPITTFDLARHDYDGDGTLEGVQTEVEGLLHELAMMLPPIGEPIVTVTSAYTKPQLKAVYNYLFVEDDGSKGIHNPAYAVGLLQASIADMKAVGDPDTDKDGLPDAWELQYFASLATLDGQGDYDQDGCSNALEWSSGTNPTLKDTDGDGFNDLAELLMGNDPLNINDNPDLEVHIYTAAEFEFRSQTGKTYQVQAVAEFQNGWQNVGEPVVGTGDMIQHLISTRQNPNTFYRVVELQTP